MHFIQNQKTQVNKEFTRRIYITALIKKKNLHLTHLTQKNIVKKSTKETAHVTSLYYVINSISCVRVIESFVYFLYSLRN